MNSIMSPVTLKTTKKKLKKKNNQRTKSLGILKKNLGIYFFSQPSTWLARNLL